MKKNTHAIEVEAKTENAQIELCNFNAKKNQC